MTTTTLTPETEEAVASRANGRTGPALLPRADLFATSDGLTILVELPGVHPDDLQVDVEAGVLRVRGRRTVAIEGEFRVLHHETRQGDYARSFRLSRDLDVSRVDAALQHGVLRIEVPRAEAFRPRTIQVQAD